MADLLAKRRAKLHQSADLNDKPHVPPPPPAPPPPPKRGSGTYTMPRAGSRKGSKIKPAETEVERKARITANKPAGINTCDRKTIRL